MNPPLDLPTNLDDGFPSIRAMNIKHLETFIHIVGKGSFAAAAEALPLPHHRHPGPGAGGHHRHCQGRR